MTAVWPASRVAPDKHADYWSWQLRGRCLEFPAEMFFPEEEGRHDRRRREEQAKRICQDCPVMMTCREHALNTPEKYGIWGATTPRERGVSVHPRGGRAS